MKPLNIKLYDIARAKMNFTDDDAMEFVSSIHELNDHRFENLVTKEFLSEKMNGIDQRFTKLESNIDLRLVQIESLINRQMAETRFELFKWMFIFCVFQVNIIIFILLLIKKHPKPSPFCPYEQPHKSHPQYANPLSPLPHP
jgi:hypothetical protein